MSGGGDGRGPLRIGDSVLLRVRLKESNGCIISEHTSSLHNAVAVLPNFSLQTALPNVHFATFTVVKANKDSRQQKRLQGTPVLYGERIQFLHTFTCKYLAVNTSKTSRTEDTDFRIELQKESSRSNNGDASSQVEGQEEACKNTTFRILSYHDVKSFGDEVYFGEQLKVEAVKAEGYFLHCGEDYLNTASFSLNCKCLELNLSATESAISLVAHYQPLKDHTRVFRAGLTVQVIHHKYQPYISAEGSFALGNATKSITVQTRQRHYTIGCIGFESSSGDTYWQFEKDGAPCSGELILTGDQCRIKHLPTRQYLVVKESCGIYEALLEPLGAAAPENEDQRDLSLFILVSPLNPDEKVHVRTGDSYVCIRHVASDRFLHLEKESDMDVTESTIRTKITVADTMSYEDAFVIEKVSDPQVELFNYVAGILPVLMDYLQLLQQRRQDVVVTAAKMEQMVTVLQELTDFLRSKYRADRKKRQKLLRNLGVLLLLIRIIEMFDPLTGDSRNQRHICWICCNVIAFYLSENSSKNKRYLADKFEFFLSQLGKNMNVERVLMCLVAENRSVVSKVTRTHMYQVIEHLTTAETPGPRLLSLLGAFCVCSGSPRANNQSFLVKTLVNEHGKSLFFLMSTEEGNSEEVFLQKPKSTDRLRATRDLSSDATQHFYFKFLAAQLNFFGQLCKGGNVQAIEALTAGNPEESQDPFLTFRALFICTSRDEVHLEMRTCCLELIKVMFVEVGSVVALDILAFPPRMLHDTLGEGGVPGVDLVTAQNQDLCNLQVWVQDYIQAPQLLSSPKMEKHSNFFLAHVLELLTLLVKCGYCYQMENIEALVKVLLRYVGVTHEGDMDEIDFQTTVSLRLSNEVKQRAVEVITALVEVQIYTQLQHHIFTFWSREVNSQNPDDTTEEVATTDEFRMITPDRYPQLPSALLADLAIVENYHLLKSSLHLLKQLYSTQSVLLRKACETQLLVTDASLQILNQIKKELPLVKCCLKRSTLDYGGVSLRSTLQNYISLCYLDSMGIEPHERNQDILYSCGVLSLLLDYISTCTQQCKEDHGKSTGDSYTEEILGDCFKLLAAMACNNTTVQQKLYEHMDDFLEIKMALPFLAEMFTQVFSGGSDLCLKVTVEQIAKIFQLLRLAKAPGQAVFMGTLQTIAKAGDVPVRRNQEYIMKHFKTANKFYHLLGEKAYRQRQRLLQKCKSSSGGHSSQLAKEEEYDLQLLLGLTNLLASCSEGKNLFSESICQGVYTATELLNILINDEIPVERKTAFARFLIWVYMDTEGDSQQSDLFHSRELIRSWMVHIFALLRSMNEVLSAMPATEQELLSYEMKVTAQELLVSTSPFSSHHQLEGHKHTIQFVKMENPADYSGLFTFVIEGVLPALKVFFAKCFMGFQKADPTFSILRLADICSGVQGVRRILSKHFTSAKQAELFRDTVLVMTMADSSVQGNFSVKEPLHQTLYFRKTASTVAYERDYEEEKEINQRFRSYMRDHYREVDEEFMKHMDHFFSVNNENPEKIIHPSTEVLLNRLGVSFIRNIYERSRLSLHESEQSIEDQLDISCLQLLSGILQTEIHLAEGHREDAETFREYCDRKLKHMQISLKDKCALQMVLPIVAHPCIEVSNKALAFLNALLYSGNKKVQSALEGTCMLESGMGMNFFVSTTKALLQEATHFFRARHSVLDILVRRAVEHHSLHQKCQELGILIGEIPVQGKPFPETVPIAIEEDLESDQDDKHSELALKLQPEQVLEPAEVHVQLELENIPSIFIKQPSVPGGGVLETEVDLTKTDQESIAPDEDTEYVDAGLDAFAAALAPATVQRMGIGELYDLRRRLEEIIHDLNKEVGKLEGDIESLRVECERMNQQLEGILKEVSRLEKLNLELKKQLREEQAKCHRLMDMALKLKCRIAEWKAQLQSTLKNYTTLLQELPGLEKQKFDLIVELVHSQQTLAYEWSVHHHLEQLLHSFLRKLLTCNKEMSALAEAHRILLAENEILRKAIEKEPHEVVTMTESNLWMLNIPQKVEITESTLECAPATSELEVIVAEQKTYDITSPFKPSRNTFLGDTEGYSSVREGHGPVTSLQHAQRERLGIARIAGVLSWTREQQGLRPPTRSPSPIYEMVVLQLLIEELACKVKLLKEKVHVLQHKKEQQEAENEALKRRLQSAQQKKGILEKENKNLKEKVAEEERKRKKLENAVEILEKRCSQLDTKITEAQHDLERAKKEKEELEEDIFETWSTLLETKDLTNGLRRKQTHLKYQLQWCLQEQYILQHQLAEFAEVNSALLTENTTLKENIAHLTGKALQNVEPTDALRVIFLVRKPSDLPTKLGTKQPVQAMLHERKPTDWMATVLSPYKVLTIKEKIPCEILRQCFLNKIKKIGPLFTDIPLPVIEEQVVEDFVPSLLLQAQLPPRADSSPQGAVEEPDISEPVTAPSPPSPPTTEQSQANCDDIAEPTEDGIAALLRCDAGSVKGIEVLVNFDILYRAKSALKLLGVMCDGQNRALQNYLREQPNHIKPINIVGEVALFIQQFFSGSSFHCDYLMSLGRAVDDPHLKDALAKWWEESMDFVNQILQTLIELCVGNHLNQVVIYDRQITDAINSILHVSPPLSKAVQEYLSEVAGLVAVKGSAVELLEAMLEPISKKSSDLAVGISGAMDIQALQSTLRDFHCLLSMSEAKEAGVTSDVRRALFRTYHVMVRLNENLKDSYGANMKLPDDCKKAWEFCSRNSRRIEVVYENLDKEKVHSQIYFQYDQKDELREEVKEEVKWRVNRDSPEDKLRDFLKWMKASRKDIEHQRILRVHPLLFFIAHLPSSSWRHRLLLLVTILLNILVLVTLVVPDQFLPPGGAERFQTDNVTFDLTPFIPMVATWFGEVSFRTLLYLFGIAHLTLTLWMVSEFVAVTWPHFKLPEWVYKLGVWVRRSKFSLEDAEVEIQRHHRRLHVPEKGYLDVKVFGWKTAYILVFLIASVLGLALHGYFYSLCLLHIAHRNDILKRVLRSVTRNGESLIWVALLGLVVLYIYSVVSFVFLHESFLLENDAADLFCRSLGECFVTVFRYGLIEGLGLVVPLASGEFDESAARLLYDVSFFIIVTTIGLNIVFGIIVDTFAELRDERGRAKKDMKSQCFICNLPRHLFDRKTPTGFDRHTKHDHNQWDYIHYAVYLWRIDISDHNAIEKYVYHQIRKKQIAFFPLRAALVLKETEATLENKVDSLLVLEDTLIDRVASISTQLKKMEESADHGSGNSLPSSGAVATLDEKVDSLSSRLEELEQNLKRNLSFITGNLEKIAHSGGHMQQPTSPVLHPQPPSEGSDDQHSEGSDENP